MSSKHSIFRFVLPVFFILILLAPLVEKTFHELGHLDDVHCTDRTTLHFHESQHDCNICDYQVSYGIEPLKNNFSGIVYSCDYKFSVPQITLPDLFSIRSLPARAPPTV